MHVSDYRGFDAQAVSHPRSLAPGPPAPSKLSLETQPPDSKGSKAIRRGRSLSSSLRWIYNHLSTAQTSSKIKAPPLPSRGILFGTTSKTNACVTKSALSKSNLNTPSTSHLSLSSSFASVPTSLSSSSSSLTFPLHPDFEAELEIALEMAPHSLGSAWSHDSYNAMQYLRARTPYPPTTTETIFNYHARGSGSDKSNSADRWRSALEIGCGPGQMSIHLATRFAKVYGQDVSPNMLKLANTVKHMSPEELAEVRLPPVQDPDRIEYREARGEDPVLPPGEKVDLIMMAACIHWMDWETHESRVGNWTKWASVLKPGGTMVITAGRPIIGPYTGERGDQLRPLRDWLLDFPIQYPEIDGYYYPSFSETTRILRAGGLYRKLPMPWDFDPALDQLWERSSYTWIPIDDCTVLGDKATSARLCTVDDAEEIAALLRKLPDWLQSSARRAAHCDNSGGDLVISMTTPRKMADWARSTSGYLKFLQERPDQKTLSLQDQDFAAVEIKKVCDSIGIDYDEEIECHHSSGVLCLRRTDKEC